MESSKVHSGKVAMRGNTTETSARCTAKNWPRMVVTVLRPHRTINPMDFPVNARIGRVAGCGKAHGRLENNHGYQHIERCYHQRGAVNAHGLLLPARCPRPLRPPTPVRPGSRPGNGVRCASPGSACRRWPGSEPQPHRRCQRPPPGGAPPRSRRWRKRPQRAPGPR